MLARQAALPSRQPRTTACGASAPEAAFQTSDPVHNSTASYTGQLAIAAVLSSLYPVMTVLLAVTILRERVTRSHVVGIALTTVAIVLIGAGSATL